MEIVVTPSAAACFREEWGYEAGDRVRVFVRYVSGGAEPYGFGIMRDDPMDPAALVAVQGITFYMEQKDAWFLEGKPLTIDLQEDGIVFRLGG